MRLSDIKGDRALDVVAEIIEPVSRIAEDPSASALFKKGTPPEGMSANMYMLQRVRDHLPILIKTHKSDIIAILSACAGVTAERYSASMSIVSLIKDCSELLTDNTFNELFTSAQSETAESAPTSAPESTEGREA